MCVCVLKEKVRKKVTFEQVQQSNGQHGRCKRFARSFSSREEAAAV